MNLPGYHVQNPQAKPEQIKQVVAAIKLAKRPMIYAGGGIIAASERRAAQFVRKTGIPVTMTVMGLGAYPSDGPLSLDMLGMHGSVYANWAVERLDLLIALGVRFDDRVTGKLEAFAKHGKIMHIDIDPRRSTRTSRPTFPFAAT